MKHFTLTFLLISFFSLFSFAQKSSNLIFYTQNGERFFAVINGVRQNNTAETNVKVTELNQQFYKLKIIFEDQNLGEVNKSLSFQPGNETVFVIKKNKKGEYKVRWQSDIPLAGSTTVTVGQAIIPYHSTPFTDNAPVTNQTTTITQTTSTTSMGNNDNVSMGVNMGGVGINMNVNINDNAVGGMNQTQTTTTTYSTTTVNSAPVQSAQPDHYNMAGYTGPIGCPWPMSNQDFQQAKNSISSKSFSDSKMTVAKQVSNANCLFASQVKEIMQLFDFEDGKLEFAKFAYAKTFDQGNYYKVNDAFTFESSINELNNTIGK